MPDNSIPLPYTLRRRRLQIRPTRYGIVFILLLLGMFVGSLNYNNRSVQTAAASDLRFPPKKRQLLIL
jgi:hypothetical protein